jgi:hypothetical protein
MHTSLESWLGLPTTELESAAADDDLDAVVLRYLAAFGPASVRDVQTWCGLTRLNAVVKRLGERLTRYTDENGTVLYDVAGAQLVDEDVRPPVRLLPEYDNILLSHADRSRIMAPEHKTAVYTENGRILATVLVDGFVAATWRYDQGTLTVRPLRPLKPSEKREVENEAERTLGMLAPGAETRVDITA